VNAQRILVAGASGYLGGFVAEEYKSRGHFVRALARSPGKLDHMKPMLDDIVKCEITRPDTIRGVCDGIDVVFSSVGITRQKDKLTFKDVDYQGNKNLLDVAQRAGVRKFIYVSVLNGSKLLHLEIVRAHEDFVAELSMGDFFKMAARGRVYLLRNGQNRVNPIHGADLAGVCADAVEDVGQEVNAGGPEIFTWREIAELAFDALNKPVKISSLPIWLGKAAVSATRIVNRHQGELLAFFTTMATCDVVAPAVGTHTLARHFEHLAQSERRAG
jgi:uncharacterized protein YbjT (DUF2867 family)